MVVFVDSYKKKRKIECNGARVGRTSSFSLRVLKAVAVSLVPGRGLCLKQLDEWNRDMEQREKGGPSTGELVLLEKEGGQRTPPAGPPAGEIRAPDAV